MTKPLAPAAGQSPLPDWLDHASVTIGEPPALPRWLESEVDMVVELPELPAVAARLPSAAQASAPRPAPDRAATFRARGREQPVETAGRRTRWRWWRPEVAVGLPRIVGALAIAASLAVAVAFAPPPHEDLPTADVVRAFGAVDRLAPGDPFLIVLDYQAARAADFAAVEQAIVRHAAARGATLISLSPRPELADRVRSLAPAAAVAELPAPGVDPEAIRRLGQRDRGSGAPAEPALRLAAGNRPLQLILVVGEQSEVARWLANFRNGANPPGVALVVGETAALAPLRATGQLTGIVRADRDLRAYSVLAGDGPPPSRSAGVTAGPALAAAVALALAAAGGVRPRRRD